jgi:hypothetical protein
MSDKYEQIESGECYTVKVNRRRKAMYIACCDCSLVHGVSITSDTPATINIMVTRDERKTGQLRRHNKPKVDHA